MFSNKRKKITGQSDITTSEGFAEVYNLYVVKLCRIIYRYTQDYSTAESIIQNVFVSLWEKRKVIRLQGSIENYLVGAVKLALLEHNRKNAIRRERMEDHLVDYCGSAHCTENEYAFTELSAKVNELTEQLPDQCRKVYEMSRVKGLSNKKIASTLLISENTVENHITKALKFLRSNLKEYQTVSGVLLLILG